MQPSNGSDSQPTENQNQQRQQQTPPPPQPLPLPQQWMPMQYPAAAMVMQHHMLPPQHYAPPPPYIPYHQYQQQHAPHAHQGSSAENKTVWVGDLHHWMDENYLHRCFASTAEVFISFVFFIYIYLCSFFLLLIDFMNINSYFLFSYFRSVYY